MSSLPKAGLFANRLPRVTSDLLILLLISPPFPLVSTDEECVELDWILLSSSSCSWSLLLLLLLFAELPLVDDDDVDVASGGNLGLLLLEQ